MKKILTLFLVLLLIFSLTACDMVGELLPSGGDRTPAAGQQQKDPDSSGKKMTQQQREAALAALDNYWDKLRLEEAQAGIKIARRNINHLRYADDTTLMAESEKLKSLDESERGE